MPLHQIYTEPGLYSAEDKKAFAACITSFYTRIGLPAFYVIVLFHEIDSDSFFIGKETYSERKESRGGKPFVRILTQHIARTTTGREARERTVQALSDGFKPWTLDRGYDVEFNIEETAGDFAREGGFPFPAPGSDAEKQWVKDNAASAYEGPTMADYLEEKGQL